MRARNLKPGFFKNEVLGSADPLYGTLFQGLWCAADREGRLEDRPLRICAEVFPYRRAITERRMDAMLQWLHDRKFITRYEVDGDAYIQVLEFKKHQNPHVKEGASKIPELRLGKPRARTVPRTVQEQGGEQPFPERARLIPDSGFSDSGLRTPYVGANPNPVQVQGSNVNGHDVAPLDPVAEHAQFERVMAAYPPFSGRQDLIGTEHHCRIRVREDGLTWDELVEAAARYAKFVAEGGVSGPRYVLNPREFFSAADRPWLQPWTPPPSKADTRLAKNVDAAEQAKRELFGDQP